jgi:hypothetical protein
MLRLGDNIRDEVERNIRLVFGQDYNMDITSHHHHHAAQNHHHHTGTTENNITHRSLTHFRGMIAGPHERRLLNEHAVNDTKEAVFSSSNVTTNNTTHSHHHTKPHSTSNMTSIGVHLRAGDIAIDGRRVLSVDDYMLHVDRIAETLQHTSRPVGLVFFCSHIQEENVISSEHMQATYNRSFKFAVLPHSDFGHIEFNVLMESKNASQYQKHDMAVQFYTDLEVLSRVDYFIGSMSNMYTLIAGMRIARGPHTRNNQSCLLDFHPNANGSFDLHCEGSVLAKNQWIMEHAGSFKNRVPGMDFVDLP